MKKTLVIIALLFTTKGIAQTPFPKEAIKWIEFQWNDPKDKDAIFLKSRLDTLDYNFNWQLDTGSPYTFINGATWDIFNHRYSFLNGMAQRADTARMGNYYKVLTPAFVFYNQKYLADTILKNDKMGGGFPADYLDKYRGYGFQMGTIGLDMFRNSVLILDFKNNKIGRAKSLSKSFYAENVHTNHFEFFKNRIIIPVTIGGDIFPFMYDCGASMFTLQTTPRHSKSFAPAVYTDTLFGINNGETGQVHNVPGGKISKQVKILGSLYPDTIVYVENGESDIFDEAKVAGIIGNRLFLDHIVIIDFKEKKFTLVQ